MTVGKGVHPDDPQTTGVARPAARATPAPATRAAPMSARSVVDDRTLSLRRSLTLQDLPPAPEVLDTGFRGPQDGHGRGEP